MPKRRHTRRRKGINLVGFSRLIRRTTKRRRRKSKR